MKYKKLKDYQLDCFRKKYYLLSKNIILVINETENNAFCILNNFLKAKVDYNYAILYF